MEAINDSDNGVFLVERSAVLRADELVADCPIICTCVDNMADPQRRLSCGYYNGTVNDGGRLRVVCGYEERSDEEIR